MAGKNLQREMLSTFNFQLSTYSRRLADGREEPPKGDAFNLQLSTFNIQLADGGEEPTDGDAFSFNIQHATSGSGSHLGVVSWMLDVACCFGVLVPVECVW